MNTVNEIIRYINKHRAYLGTEPTAIGLEYHDYVKVAKEMGFDGRCSNIKAKLYNVPIVDLSRL